jgi:hypothetical protein
MRWFRKALLAAAAASFVLAQIIAAVGWTVDVLLRLVFCSLNAVAIYLREKADEWKH